jgi:hypothetical protein
VGMQSVTVRDVASASLSGAASINVLSGPATTFAITGLGATATSGSPVVLTVTARDVGGNTASAYGGTASITLTDPAAVRPASVTFIGGVANLSVNLRTAGSQTVTVSDAATPGLTASASTQVVAGPAARYVISPLPASVAAGAAVTFTVKAQDAAGNMADGYAGLASLESSDPAALLPPATRFAGGLATGVSVTFRTPGVQSVTVRDSDSGSVSATASTTVTLESPTATLTEPTDGAVLSGEVALMAQGTVSTGTTLATVEVLVDGAVVASGTTSPFSAVWDSTTVPNGEHTITVRTVDAAGNAALSPGVRVSVNNTTDPPPGGGCGCGTTDGGAGSAGMLGLLFALRAVTARSRRPSRRAE